MEQWRDQGERGTGKVVSGRVTVNEERGGCQVSDG